MKERSSIIKDFVNMEIYQKLNYATACEDCSHFASATSKCTLGYPTEPHLKKNQMRDLIDTGRMAFCRTHEID